VPPIQARRRVYDRMNELHIPFVPWFAGDAPEHHGHDSAACNIHIAPV
jgi:hypothetical protein